MPRNPGLEDAIPLGLTERPTDLCVMTRPCRTRRQDISVAILGGAFGSKWEPGRGVVVSGGFKGNQLRHKELAAGCNALLSIVMVFASASNRVFVSKKPVASARKRLGEVHNRVAGASKGLGRLHKRFASARKELASAF